MKLGRYLWALLAAAGAVAACLPNARTAASLDVEQGWRTVHDLDPHPCL